MAAGEAGAGDDGEPELGDALEAEEGAGGEEEEDLGDEVLVGRDDLVGRIALQLHFQKSGRRRLQTEREREERRGGEGKEEGRVKSIHWERTKRGTCG